jgi:DNA-binding Xre family transcriptional regulator
MIWWKSPDLPYLIHEANSLNAQEEGNMKTKRMILPKELATQISSVKAELEAIAGENQVTDVTAEMLYELCKLLDEVC